MRRNEETRCTLLLLPSQLVGFLETWHHVSRDRVYWRRLQFSLVNSCGCSHMPPIAMPVSAPKAQHQQKALPCSLAEIPRGVQSCLEVVRAEHRPTKFSKLLKGRVPYP